MIIGAVYVDRGVLSQEEVREALADNPNSGYSNIDADDVPENDTFADVDMDDKDEAGSVFDEALALDEWDESKHHRKDNGQFGEGVGEVSISSKDIMKDKSEEEFRSGMLNQLSNLNGTSVKNASLNANIEIRTSSIKKYKSFSADIKKLYIVPQLPDLLEKANFYKTEKPYDERETSIRSYSKADMEILIDNQSYNVHFTVKEDQRGNYFWDAQVQ